MSIVSIVKPLISAALTALYKQDIKADDLILTRTKPEFEGDYTLVLFSFVKTLRKSPEQLGNDIGGFLREKHPQIFTQFNVIKGFLNLTIADSYWTDFLAENFPRPGLARRKSN